MLYLYIALGVIFILIISILLSSNFAVNKFMDAYDEFDKGSISSFITAYDFAKIVNKNEFKSSLDVAVSDGSKYDNYYMTKTKKIVLSPHAIDSASVAGLSVVAHELGHAEQERDGDKKFLRCLRMRKLVRFIGAMILPVFLAGIITAFCYEIITGAYIVGASFLLYLFCIIVKISTLGIEKDASKRGMELLNNYADMTKEELDNAKYILKRAYMTYFSDIIKTAFSWTGLTGKTNLY